MCEERQSEKRVRRRQRLSGSGSIKRPFQQPATELNSLLRKKLARAEQNKMVSQNWTRRKGRDERRDGK
jgi:hypothetical protein